MLLQCDSVPRHDLLIPADIVPLLRSYNRLLPDGFRLHRPRPALRLCIQRRHGKTQLAALVLNLRPAMPGELDKAVLRYLTPQVGQGGYLGFGPNGFVLVTHTVGLISD